MKKVLIFVINPADDINENGIMSGYKYNEKSLNSYVTSIRPIWEFLTAKQVLELFLKQTDVEISQKVFNENFDVIH